MSESTLTRELFSRCRVAATLTRIGQGILWDVFLNNAIAKSQVTEAMRGIGDEFIVGHATSLAALRTYIQSHARRSYRLSTPVAIQRIRLKKSGAARAKIVKQSCGPGHFADLSIEVTPQPELSGIRLIVPQSPEVATEMHEAEVAEAILEGICVAAIAEIEKPVIGFQALITEARWHDVDSYPGLFRQVAYQAMNEILAER